MRWSGLWVVVFILFKHARFGQSVANCVTVSPCKCTYDDGSGSVDLTGIGNTNGTPRFKDLAGSDGMKYSYNPCFSFQENACVDTAVCQFDGVSTYTDIGIQQSAAFAVDPTLGTLRVEYTSSGSGIQRTSVVYLNCDQSTTVAELYPTGMTGFNTYSFQLFTECACPGQCISIDPEVITTISVGTVLCIAFICVVAVYFTGGILFNRFSRQRSGAEMIPHVEFWKGLPGATKCHIACCSLVLSGYSDFLLPENDMAMAVGVYYSKQVLPGYNFDIHTRKYDGCLFVFGKVSGRRNQYDKI